MGIIFRVAIWRRKHASSTFYLYFVFLSQFHFSFLILFFLTSPYECSFVPKCCLNFIYIPPHTTFGYINPLDTRFTAKYIFVQIFGAAFCTYDRSFLPVSYYFLHEFGFGIFWICSNLHSRQIRDLARIFIRTIPNLMISISSHVNSRMVSCVLFKLTWHLFLGSTNFYITTMTSPSVFINLYFLLDYLIFSFVKPLI